ncbi:MAG TPA: substrate-binding domain-containing protein [bacterium]|nr:substrate-binding domain-containing protein [bacterium]
MFRKAALILAGLFALAFVGATLLNADLVSRSRHALTSGLLRDPSTYEAARRHLVVIVPDTDDSFFRGLIEGILESAKSAEAAIQVFRYSGANPSEADIHFETAVSARVDGIIMYSTSKASVVRRAASAAENGVVFIPVGTDPPDGAVNFVGSGSFLQGFEGGKIIGSQLGASARIGAILPTSGEGDLRNDPLLIGLSSGIGAFPGARVISVSRSKPGRLSGEEAVATVIRNNPGLNALFCSSAYDTEGAAQVIIDQNLVGRVLIIGADETSEILRFIDKGVVAASIVRDSRRIGMEAVAAFSRLKDGRPSGPAVEVGFTVIGADGASQ